MSEERFTFGPVSPNFAMIKDNGEPMDTEEVVDLLNEQQELIEELHSSDHMGWGRTEKFEKELKQKKIYIKRLEYKVQKFKEMNSEQQDTINKLRKILAAAEDTIEIRLPEHYLKEYENIKHNIIGDNDE